MLLTEIPNTVIRGIVIKKAASDKYINMKRWCPRLFYSYRVLILFPLV